MAYREIEESEVAIDAPISHALVTALRDNLTAIVEGQATAPTTTTHSKSSVINRACFSKGTPSAGDYIIAETSGECRGDDTSVTTVVIQTTGIYKINLNARIGSTERSGDRLPAKTQATLNVNKNGSLINTLFFGVISVDFTDRINPYTFFEIVDGSDVQVSAKKSTNIAREVQCTAGDVISVAVDGGSDGTGDSTVSVVLSLGVADSDAMYGVDARSVLT